ncbi:MAG TPA: hypothetical protein VHW09_18390 [Bryobacteraceae bacterium]|nr:hypothetical protein [Bryobacteraceae bacterium]
MQKLRGRVYASDGAVRSRDLTADGRHKLKVDDNSWHILSLNPQGEVVACLRYLEESFTSGFEKLRVYSAAVARCPVQGARFRRAVETEMERARKTQLAFSEFGGWAVSEEHRWSPEALRIILGGYALAELLGSCLGVATATFRHGSAGILRRIGLAPLEAGGEEIQPYHDPQYDCLMQILRFDSRSPNPRYRSWVDGLMADLVSAPVVYRESRARVFAAYAGVGVRTSTPRLVDLAAVPVA